MNENKKKKQVIVEEVIDKNVVIAWVKTHKKKLIIIGISIPTILAIVLGVRYKETLIKMLEDLQETIKESSLYCNKWFQKVTDDELNIEREKIRLAYCSSGDNWDVACQLENLLRKFDQEMSKRAWGNTKPHASSIHREHGWYLPNDD